MITTQLPPAAEPWRAVTADLIRSEAARYGYTLARDSYIDHDGRCCCAVGALALDVDDRTHPTFCWTRVEDRYGLASSAPLSMGFEGDDPSGLATDEGRYLYDVGREVAESLGLPGYDPDECESPDDDIDEDD